MRYFKYILLIFMIFFTGCEKKIKVALVVGLSGNYSDVANDIKKGVELAVEEVNKNGGIDGKKIELIIKDDKGDLNIARKIDEELIKQHIPVVIGHITSKLSTGVIDLFNNSDTILFSPTTSTTELSNIDDNFIRIQPANDFNDIKKLIQYIAKNHKYINIIYDANNKSYSESMIKAIKKSKLLIVDYAIGVKNTNLDYKTLVKKLKNKPIFIIAPTKYAANIVKNLRENGFQGLISVSGSAFSRDFIKIAGKYAEGVIFITNFNALSQHEKFLKFKRDFVAKFGYVPSSTELFGYETIMVLKDVLGKKNIKQHLINHKFEGLQGEIFINKYGDVKRKSFLFVVHNGTFLEIR